MELNKSSLVSKLDAGKTRLINYLDNSKYSLMSILLSIPVVGKMTGELLNYIQKDRIPFDSSGDYWELGTSVGLSFLVYLYIKSKLNIIQKGYDDVKALFDNAKDGFYVVDKSGKIIDVNSEGVTRLGYTREELIGRQVSEVDSQIHKGNAKLRIAELLQNGHVRFETEHVTKDGNILPTEVVAKLIRNTDGQYIFSIARDISDIKELLKEKKLNIDCLESLLSLYAKPIDEKCVVFDAALDSLTTIFGGQDGFIFDVERLELHVSANFFDRIDDKVKDKKAYIRDFLLINEFSKDSGFGTFNLTDLEFKDIKNIIYYNYRQSDGTRIIVGITNVTKRLGSAGKKYLKAYVHGVFNYLNLQTTKSELKLSEEKYKILFDNIPTGVIAIDEKGEVLESNGYIEKLTGKRILNIVEFLQSCSVKTDMCQLQTEENNIVRDFFDKNDIEHKRIVCVRGLNNEIRYLNVTFSQLGVNGYAALINFEDITLRIKIEQRLKETIDFIEKVFDGIPAAVFFKTLDEKYRLFNKYICDFFGIKREDALNQDAKNVFKGLYHQNWSEYDRQLINGEKETVSYEYETVKGDGTKAILYETKTMIFDPYGKPLGIIGVSFDISSRKIMEKRIQDQQNLLSCVLKHSPDQITIYDVNHNVVYTNNEKDLIISTESQSSCWYSFNAKQCNMGLVGLCGNCPIKEVINTKKVYDHECIDEVNGIYKRIRAYPVFDSNGDLTHIASNIRDIKERKITEKEVKFLAEHDGLTKLLNRNTFLKLATEYAVSKTNLSRRFDNYAILFIDLDRFKSLNDLYGHKSGDLVLSTIGKRLKQSCRETDLVARFGGDEFVICLKEIDTKENLIKIIDKIQKIINQPIAILIDGNKHICELGSSIGVSFFPDFKVYDVDAVEKLINRADQAMYDAKKTGTNSYKFATD